MLLQNFIVLKGTIGEKKLAVVVFYTFSLKIISKTIAIFF